jgi:hypothetical protein
VPIGVFWKKDCVVAAFSLLTKQLGGTKKINARIRMHMMSYWIVPLEYDQITRFLRNPSSFSI